MHESINERIKPIAAKEEAKFFQEIYNLMSSMPKLPPEVKNALAYLILDANKVMKQTREYAIKFEAEDVYDAMYIESAWGGFYRSMKVFNEVCAIELKKVAEYLKRLLIRADPKIAKKLGVQINKFEKAIEILQSPMVKKKESLFDALGVGVLKASLLAAYVGVIGFWAVGLATHMTLPSASAVLTPIVQYVAYSIPFWIVGLFAFRKYK